MAFENFSDQQIEQLREVLLKHDAEKRRQPNVFDLNNPPKVPYVHQEFPKMVFAPDFDHDKAGHPETPWNERQAMTKIVKDKKELEAALKEGFLLEPPKQEPKVEAKKAKGKKAEEPPKHE